MSRLWAGRVAWPLAVLWPVLVIAAAVAAVVLWPVVLLGCALRGPLRPSVGLVDAVADRALSRVGTVLPGAIARGALGVIDAVSARRSAPESAPESAQAGAELPET